MDKTLKKLKKYEREKAQDDVGKDSAESEEDRDRDDDDDDDEEEEDDEAEQGRPVFNKRTNQEYGYGSVASPKTEPKLQDDGPAKKRTKRKEAILPKDSKEFTKQWLAEKAHVERLIDDGYNNEDTDATNWWAYENEREPELEELVDHSGTKLDSGEPFYTFGGKRKPDPPIPPYQPEPPPQPLGPPEPFMPLPQPAPPPRPQPPPAPIVRLPQAESSNTVSTIGSFFRNLFGFGGGSNNAESFSGDPFFQGFQRSMPDGTPTVVTVDKTKEILTTAIEIGETLRSPNQCNSLFNGCKYQYIELLHVIDDIRESLAERGKNDFHSSQFYTGNEEENYSGGTADDTHSSYGYKSSLSETSQAETLSPDYSAAAAAVTQKNGGRKKKKKSSLRAEKFSSMSREASVEIGSDEPTMYGSGQQEFDFHHPYSRHGHSLGSHQQKQPSHYNHQSGGYQPSYQFEDVHVRQPKSIWATILSWFGFGR